MWVIKETMRQKEWNVNIGKGVNENTTIIIECADDMFATVMR